jgi:hypothetical protein
MTYSLNLPQGLFPYLGPHSEEDDVPQHHQKGPRSARPKVLAGSSQIKIDLEGGAFWDIQRFTLYVIGFSRVPKRSSP